MAMAAGGEQQRAAAWLKGQRERERRWRGHIAAWRVVGGSQAAYCRAHGLAPAEFSWWKYELPRRDGKLGGKRFKASADGSADFIPVRIASGGTAPFELVLRGGHTLRLTERFDEAALKRLLKVLEGGADSTC